MGNYTPNPFMAQPAHLPPLIYMCVCVCGYCRWWMAADDGW